MARMAHYPLFTSVVSSNPTCVNTLCHSQIFETLSIASFHVRLLVIFLLWDLSFKKVCICLPLTRQLDGSHNSRSNVVLKFRPGTLQVLVIFQRVMVAKDELHCRLFI